MAEVNVVDELLSGSVVPSRSDTSSEAVDVDVSDNLLDGDLNQDSLDNPEFAARAALMAPIDLSIARTKNDDFGDFLRAQAEKRQPDETDAQMFKRQFGELPQEEVGAGEGVARGFVQGGTFGAGDELVAAGTAALNRIVGKDPDVSFDDLYDTYLARERDKIDKFREDSPGLAFGAEIAGAIPTAVAAAPAGVATTLGGRVAAGVATGGVQGGIFGFNAGEGEGRVGSAATGAALGGGIGLAAPAAGGALRKLIENRAANRAAKDVGSPRAATDIVRRATEADGSLAGPGAARIAQAGKDAMLADAGPNTLALLDTAVQKSGPAATVAREAVETRATQAGQTITGALDDALGAPQGVRGVAREISRKTATARQDAYEAAYSKPIDYASDAGRRIEEVLDRIPDDIAEAAVRKANQMMRLEGVPRARQIVAEVADDGAVTFADKPNIMQLDFIKRALGEMGAEAVDNFGRRTGEGIRFSGVARDLRQAVAEAVPEYGRAVRLGGDKIATDNALRLGREMLRPGVTREVVEEGFEELSVEARQAAMQGLRGHIDDALANVKRAMTDSNMDAREAVKAVRELSSRANREKVGILLGDKRAARLFTEIDRVTAALDLRAGVAANSKTFARTSLDDVISRQTDDGAVNALRSGEPVNAAKRVTQAVLGRTPAAKERIADETYSALVEMLTGPRGAEALRIIKQLEATQARIGPAAEAARRIAERTVGANTAVAGPLQR